MKTLPVEDIGIKHITYQDYIPNHPIKYIKNKIILQKQMGQDELLGPVLLHEDLLNWFLY